MHNFLYQKKLSIIMLTLQTSTLLASLRQWLDIIFKTSSHSWYHFVIQPANLTLILPKSRFPNSQSISRIFLSTGRNVSKRGTHSHTLCAKNKCTHLRGPLIGRSRLLPTYFRAFYRHSRTAVAPDLDSPAIGSLCGFLMAF